MLDIVGYQSDTLGALVFIVAFVLDFAVFFGADIHRLFARTWRAPAENVGAVIMGLLWRLGFFIFAYPLAVVVAIIILALVGDFIHEGFYV